MQDFSNIDLIKKIDPQGTLSSTELLVKQCANAWDEVISRPIDKEYTGIENIVFCGMGASVYGALVVKALEGHNLQYPSEIISDYHLPPYVSNRTLVVLTSYSGSTEEVLSCTLEAIEKKAKIIILTKGGALAELAKVHKFPSYIFDGKLNPAGVPRLGNGYTILGLLGMLSKLKILTIEEQEITDAITRLDEKVTDLKKIGMQDSELFTQHMPVVIAAEHLAGNAQILRNQFNETSKTFSSLFFIPDLNHHLIEGLQFPTFPVKFFVLDSPNYSQKIKKRVALTIDVIQQNKLPVHTFTTSGQTFYDDFLEVMMYGSFLTLFLALRHDQNPAVNPWVDYFKEKLR